MAKEIKKNYNIEEMKAEQALSWMVELFKNYENHNLTQEDRDLFPQLVTKVVTELEYHKNKNIKNEQLINFALDNLQKKHLVDFYKKHLV